MSRLFGLMGGHRAGRRVGDGSVLLVGPEYLNPVLTLTRASSGTYFDAAGVLQTAGTNEPRFEYDPSTGLYRGLLIEEARTNLLLNSATLSTQSVTVTAVAHTLSFYGTGTVTLSGASTAGPLVGTGADDRVTLTFTPSAGSLTLTVTGTVSNAQLEAGAFATSYIPTTGTAQSRAADSCVCTDLSLIGFNASAGAMFTECVALNADTAPWQFNNAASPSSAAERISAYIGSSYFGLIVQIEAVNQALLTNTYTRGPALVKHASAWAANDFACSLAGGAVTSDLSGSVPPISRLWIGDQSTRKINSHIKTLRYYPERITNAQLQALTA